MSDAWPEPDVLSALHARLVAGGRTAWGDFADAVFRPLAVDLRRRHPEADEHAVQTAAGDAVLSVLRNPHGYDPARSPLRSFLVMAAERDLFNVQRKESRHGRNRSPVDCVELPAPGGNTPPDDLPSFDDPEIAAAITALPTADQCVFELMRAGERRTEVFAAAMGVGHLAAEVRWDEVMRAKDRIKKRLQRAGGKA